MRGRFVGWVGMSAVAAALVVLSGCAGGGGVSLIGGSPTTTQVLDPGQVAVLTASVVNDPTHQGVSWSVSGAGSLSFANSTPSAGTTLASVTYTAPATESAAASATVTATSIHTPSQSVSFAIAVNPALTITSATPASGVVGTAYSATLIATGGSGAHSFSVSAGSLPTGLALSSAGVLSGTPSVAGSSTFTVAVTDSATTPFIATQVMTLTINPTVPTITTKALPNAAVGVAYSQALAYSGGAAGGTYAITSGVLPAGSGLTLSSSGVIAGTPVAGSAGTTYTFGVAVTSGTQTSAPVQLSITVTNPLVITSAATLPAGSTGVEYSYQLQVTGGTGSGYVWSVASGTLPTGLVTLPSNGAISFTPSAAGVFAFTAKVTDSAGTSVSAPLSVTVATTPLVVTTMSVPSANVGLRYSQQLAYTGGPGGAATWSIASGSLPDGSGISLSASGLLSGTPAGVGNYTFSVVVTVGTQSSVAQSLTLNVSNISITSGGVATGEVNLPFAFPQHVSGGTGPYTWSVAPSSNPLPAGLTLDAATGLISGTPTSAGSPVSVSILVADSAASTAMQSIAITVNAARSSINNAQLNGEYAFLLNGFDKAGNPLAVAGKIVADGSGNITGGVLDTNGTALLAPQLNVTLMASVYNVGADRRGKLVLTNASGSTTFVLAMNKTGSGGYLTEFDSNGQSLSGTIALQDATAFSTAAIKGGFAFGMSGFQSGATNHVGSIGELQFAAAGGTVSSGELIESTRGFTPLTTSAGMIAVGANGRGTVALTLPGGVVNFVVYAVSAKELLLLSADASSSASPVLSGRALGQTILSGNFSAASLSGAAVEHSQRVIAMATGFAADVDAGIYTFSAGKIALSGDENAAGVISSKTLGGAYMVATNGRVATLFSGGLGGCLDCATPQTFFYLAGANQGFSLDFYAGNATGSFEPQTATTLSGAYAVGSVAPLGVSAMNTAEISVDGGGSVAGVADQNNVGTLAPDVALASTAAASANGRVLVTGADGNAEVVYVISPSRGVALSLSDSGPVVQELQQ